MPALYFRLSILSGGWTILDEMVLLILLLELLIPLDELKLVALPIIVSGILDRRLTSFLFFGDE